MAGGNWTYQNKVRPGVYMNFRSQSKAMGNFSEKGIATLPVAMNWGAPKEIMALNAAEIMESAPEVLGYDFFHPENLLVRECFKRASKVLLYRVNGGVKATVADGGVGTFTAKYPGMRGNDLTVQVQVNGDDNTKFDVMTYVDQAKVASETVGLIEDLAGNPWVDFAGTGAPTAGTFNLAGGTNTAPVTQDYVDYLAAVELHDFHTMGYPGTDETIKGAMAAFAKRVRDDEGKKVQVVLADYTAGDFEGVISVKNGVVLSDNTAVTADQAVAWVTGATAAAEAHESLTFSAYDGSVDANPRYTNTQIEEALLAGEFLFVESQGKAVVEQDINSLTSFTPEKDQAFSKNKVIRVMDAVGNDLKKTFNNFFLGKVNNDEDGRSALKNEIVNYIEGLQEKRAVQNFDPKTDVIVRQGSNKDSVLVDLYIQPVDAIEKIYMTVEVK